MSRLPTNHRKRMQTTDIKTSFMSFCGYCGSRIDPEQPFCSECGQPRLNSKTESLSGSRQIVTAEAASPANHVIPVERESANRFPVGVVVLGLLVTAALSAAITLA